MAQVDSTESRLNRTWVFQSSANLLGSFAAIFILAVCMVPHRGLFREAFRVFRSHARDVRLLITFLVCVAALGVHAYYYCHLCIALYADERGQPLFFTEGISPWPTMGLHALGTVISVVGLFFAITRIIDAKCELSADKKKLFEISFGGCDTRELKKSFHRFRLLLDGRRLGVVVGVLVTLYYGMTGFMFKHIGNEIPPTRGIEVFVADRWYLFWAIIPFLATLFLALVVSIPTHLLLDKLRSTASTRLRSSSELASSDDSRRESASIALSALDLTRHLTRNLGSLIWPPAAALFLLFVSRSTLFTRWTWPPALVVTFLVCALLILIVSSHVRSTAHRLRNELVQILGRIRATTNNGDTARMIENAASYMTAEKSGAFAPLLEHPVVQAGLLPILGLMLSSALDILPKYLGAS